MSRMKWGVGVVAVSMLVAGLSACSSSETGAGSAAPGSSSTVAGSPSASGQSDTTAPASGAGAAEPATIRVIVGLPNFGSASPFLIAEKLGYYKEEGITVKVSQSENVTAAVAAGQADVGTAGLGVLNEAIEKGLGFQAFSGFRCNSQIRFAVAKGIDSVKDLNGKSVVLAAAAGDPQIALRKSELAKVGWNLDSVDTKMVFVPGGSSAWAKLLVNGKIALTPFYSSSKRVIDQAGGKVILDTLIHTPQDVMFANTSWLSKDPALVQKFLEATMRATAYNLDLSKETQVLDIAQQDGYNVADSKYDYKAGVDVFCKNLYLEPKSVATGFQQNGVKNPVPFDKFATITSLEAAQKALGLNNDPIV